jgi:parallel beta-helix repeat protein
VKLPTFLLRVRTSKAPTSRLFAKPGLEVLDERDVPAIMVTTVQDNGDNNNPLQGSLRAAIIAANSQPGATIEFNLGGGIHDLKLAAALPDLTANGVTIDGGNPMAQEIEIDGQAAGNIAGLVLSGNKDSVANLDVVRCESSGILVEGKSDSITACNIGTDVNHEMGLSNGIGVYVFETTGLSVTSSFIAGNTADGIQVLESAGITLTSNWLNTNADDGIRILGEMQNSGQPFTTSIDANIFVSNGGNGIHIVDSSNNIIGKNSANYIGDDTDGDPGEGNVGDGILIESDQVAHAPSAHNIITSNYIADNLSNGVHLEGGATANNVVVGNYIGLSLQPMPDTDGVLYALGNKLDGVAITDGAHNNRIGGTGLFGNGRGNLISANGGSGVGLSDAGTTGNRIQGNMIGTDINGTSSLANAVDGVVIANGAANNLIGGLGGTAKTTGQGNLISGNSFEGVDITDAGTTGNRLEGNFIGTDVTGAKTLTVKALTNQDGVLIEKGASGNEVGVASPGLMTTLGNVISANQVAGVVVRDAGTTGNTIQANRIGTDSNGNIALGNGAYGVVILNGASGNTVGGVLNPKTLFWPGNLISDNGLDGVFITDNGTTNNTVAGNFIGTDATGSKALGNGALGNGAGGVVISNSASNNTIGGSTPLALNVISGNDVSGVIITNAATSNTVEFNRIGTRAAGLAALGNAQDGVDLLSGGNTLTNNLISGNVNNGVHVTSSSNTIQGNRIGTNIFGTASVGSQQDGILMDVQTGAGGNTVGGATAGTGNLISGNAWNGIDIINSTGNPNNGNVIEGNKIGTNAAGKLAVANLHNGILVTNTTGYTIGGSTSLARNLISGNQQDGIDITGYGSHDLSVLGNLIGTDATGMSNIPNIGNGVHLDMGAHNNVIGGTAPGDGNLISGNNVNGVLISYYRTLGNQVLGNRIGTNILGQAAVGNVLSGVMIDQAANNTIGGDVAGAGNLISGNGHDGVEITNAAIQNKVEGNKIGTDVTGAKALGNGQQGVELLQGASMNVVGGTPGSTSSPQNVISGNKDNGVMISGTGTNLNQVEGNYIGTTWAGKAALGNNGAGVLIMSGAQKNQIGGGAVLTGAGNVISANKGDGVRVTGMGTNLNVVQGNAIGTNMLGTLKLGNAGRGVFVLEGAQNNLIGGGAPQDGNTIAFNMEAGVSIGETSIDSTTISDPVLSNRIYSNGGLGIDLGDDGVTANTVGGPHVGPNDLQNTPVIDSITFDGANTVVRVRLNSIANSTFTIQLYANTTQDVSKHGQGERLLLPVPGVGTDGTGNIAGGFIDVTVPGNLSGLYITATATDPLGNTSEFAQDVKAK